MYIESKRNSEQRELFRESCKRLKVGQLYKLVRSDLDPNSAIGTRALITVFKDEKSPLVVRDDYLGSYTCGDVFIVMSEAKLFETTDTTPIILLKILTKDGILGWLHLNWLYQRVGQIIPVSIKKKGNIQL